jgi:hypothetical protein
MKFKITYTNNSRDEIEAKAMDLWDKDGTWIHFTDPRGDTVKLIRAKDVKRVEKAE